MHVSCLRRSVVCRPGCRCRCRCSNISNPARAPPSAPLTHRSSPGRAAAPGEPLAGRHFAAGGDVDDQPLGLRVRLPPATDTPCDRAVRPDRHHASATSAPRGRAACQRNQGPPGVGAHGRQVAQVDGQCLVADVAGRAPRAREMDVFDQGVGGEHESGPAPRFDHRGVVARPDQDVGPRSGQDAPAGAPAGHVRPGPKPSQKSVPRCRVGRIAEPASAGGAAVRTALQASSPRRHAHHAAVATRFGFNVGSDKPPETITNNAGLG